MWKSVACVAAYLIGVAEMTMLPGRTWQLKASGFVSGVGYTYKRQVRVALDCSEICSKMSSSKSYFYYDDTRECQCHDCAYTGTEFSVQYVPNARYYEVVNEVIDPASMTELPCPSDASASTGVIQSGSSRFRVRAFIDTGRSYDDAQAVCVANGGLLYKATTLEKFQLAKRLMMECPAYILYEDYFVNGKYNDVTARYETSDGDLVPMTSDFWAPGKPNDAGIRCILMSAQFIDCRFDDISCDVTSVPKYAFCEIPQ